MKIITAGLLAKSVCVAGLLLGFASVNQLQAQEYDITFTGGGSAANGQIDVVGGIATSGYLDVTAGPNQGTYNLLTANYENINGDDLNNDNEVTPNSTPFVDGNGVAFGNYTSGFALWSDSPTTYTLWGYNYTLGTGSSSGAEWGVPYVGGTATITPVPEPATVSCLLLGLGVLACARRFKKYDAFVSKYKINRL